MKPYQHITNDGSIIPLPCHKTVCVGRNYAAHAKELGNEVPNEPVLFIKPKTAMVNWTDFVFIPTDRGEVHHELEIALLLNQTLTNADVEQVAKSVAGVTLALDLTLRDVQSRLKAMGKPWEIAKAFDGSCPVGPWLDLPSTDWLKEEASLCFEVNGEIRQRVTTNSMLWSSLDLICYISRHFTLEPGDIVLTGTPAGVGPLYPGDKLTARLDHDLLVLQSEVSSRDK